MDDSEESSALLAPEATVSPQASRSSYPVAVVVVGLFLGAIIASVDVAYNIATYAYVGSDFDRVQQASWLIVIHELIHAMVQPIYASLSNTYGRKRLTLVAYGLFALDSVLCGFSAVFAQVIVGRIVLSTGVSGIAVLVTFTLSDVTSLRKFAILQSGHGICETTGLVFGGFLGSKMAFALNWRLLYRINSILIFIPFIWLFILMPPQSTPSSGPCDQRNTPHSSSNRLSMFDFPGATLLIARVLLAVLSMEPQTFRGAWPIVFGFSAVFALLLFIRVETGPVKNPLVPLRLFKSHFIKFVVGCNSVTMFAYTMSIYQISFYLQVLTHSGKENVGLGPLYIGLGVGFLLGGLAVRTTGNFSVTVLFGSASSSLCYALLASRVTKAGHHLEEVLPAFLGVFLATSLEGLIVALISHAKQEDHAALIGMNSVIVSICGTLGTKISATAFYGTALAILKSKLRDDTLATDVISRVFHSLDELRSVDPVLQTVVIDSLRESHQTLHIWVTVVSIVATISSLGLRFRK